MKNKFYHLQPRKYFLKGGKHLIITFILFQSKGDFPVELFNEGVPKGVRQTPVSCNSATDCFICRNLDKKHIDASVKRTAANPLVSSREICVNMFYAITIFNILLTLYNISKPLK